MTGPAVLAGVGHCSDYRRPKEPSVDREARLSLYDQVTTKQASQRGFDCRIFRVDLNSWKTELNNTKLLPIDKGLLNTT